MDKTENNISIKIFDKTFLITTIACIIPAFFGLALYNRLPETMAIHWNFSGEPDNFAHKALTVFCLPLICVAVNTICHLAVNIQRKKSAAAKESKFNAAAKWLCVAVSFFASSVTYLYALNCKFDMIKTVLIFCSLVFIILGNYMPKADYPLKHSQWIEEEKVPVLKRITGFSMFIMGIGVFAVSFFSFGKYIFIGTLAFFIILNFILMMMFKKKNPKVQ